MNKTKKRLLTIILMGFVVNGHTNSAEEKAHVMIQQVYQQFNQSVASTPPDMSSRLDTISAQFLGRPYRLGALGEGDKAVYDQSPLYRVDSFDCETFVDTVLAIALANSIDGFKQCINKIRYEQGKVEFTYRNHFTDLDWNENNQQQGYIKDITGTIKNIDQQPVAKIATAIINKPSWYQHLDTTHIKLRQASAEEQKSRLLQLQQEGSKLPVKEAVIPYIPFEKLFLNNDEPDPVVFSQIPEGAIIEVIRPNWDLRKIIGTALNVSHLGFVFRKNGELVYRMASSSYNQVVDVPLVDYLKKARNSPTIKGINIQVVLPKEPKNAGC